MFTNGIPFVVSVLRGVNFTRVKDFIRRFKTVLNKFIWKTFQFYKNIGYTIKMLLMDRKFEGIYDSLPEEADINTTAAN